MKAYARISPDNQEVQVMDFSKPQIQPDEVLIGVKAFGVGIHDRYYIPSNVEFPYPIGSEGAGVIEKLGTESTNFQLGDRVLFTTSLQPKGGSWAEYAAAKESTLIPLPENLSFVQGAAIPIAGKTALESMRALQLEQGDSLFIAGASGAIGSFVIQLAAAKGVHISASASKKNHAYMKSLGVEKTVDYHDPKWEQQIKEWSSGGVIAALAIQPGTEKESLSVVKDGGILITVSGYNQTLKPERNITIKQMKHHQDMKQKMIDLVQTISSGQIKLEIENEYPFSQVLDALQKTETRHARGKSVVNLD